MIATVIALAIVGPFILGNLAYWLAVIVLVAALIRDRRSSP